MARKRKKKNIRYPNQQMVYIHKKISHKKNFYFNLDTSKTLEAMRKLTGTGFKMYIYLCQNINGHTIYFSGNDFCKATGLSSRTYILAKKELIEKHYLILREDGDFDFYNAPFKVLTKKDEIIEGIVSKIREENN